MKELLTVRPPARDMSPSSRPSWWRNRHVMLSVALIAAALTALALVSRSHYLLFHCITEIIAVAVAGTIFSIGWNARQFVQNNLLLVLSVAYLVVGALDAAHLLTYAGMSVVGHDTSHLSVQYWMAARYVESASFLLGVLLLTRAPVRAELLFGLYLVAGAALALIVYPLQLFPTTYVPGQGLTSFKVGSEVAVATVLSIAGVLLYRRRAWVDRLVLVPLLGAIFIKVFAELAFTTYVGMFGPANALGHVLKVASKILLYAALVQWSLRKPYETLFLGLARSEEELKRELQERTRAELALKEAKEAAEAANRAKSDFLANMSHEIRTPMNAVIGMTDLVLETRLSDEQKELLGMARSSAGALLGIINDILDFSKIEAGKLELEQVDFKLVPVLEGAWRRWPFARTKRDWS